MIPARGDRKARRGSSLIAVLLSLTTASPVHAEDVQKRRAAELFSAGVSKMSAGRCDQAPVGDQDECETAARLFAESYGLYPAGLGALRNLAKIEGALGRTASALRHFREVAERAKSDPLPSRRAWAAPAAREADALEPIAPRLRIAVGPAAVRAPIIEIDGQPLGSPVEVVRIDPGEHTVTASAAGYRTARETFTIRASQELEIRLQLEPVVAPADAMAVSTSVGATKGEGPTSPTRSPDTSRPSRTGPIALGIVGAATVAAGLGLGVAAWRARASACEGGLCDRDGYERAQNTARSSTIVTGIGLGLVGISAVWWLVTEVATPPRAALSPVVTPTTVGFSGTLRF
jgi:hypothetical protein